MDNALQPGGRSELEDLPTQVRILHNRLRSGDTWLGRLAVATHWGHEAARQVIGPSGEQWLTDRLEEGRSKPTLRHELQVLGRTVWPWRDPDTYLVPDDLHRDQRSQVRFVPRVLAGLGWALLEKLKTKDDRAHRALELYELFILDNYTYTKKRYTKERAPFLEAAERVGLSFRKLLDIEGWFRAPLTALEAELGEAAVLRVAKAELMSLALGDRDPLAERVSLRSGQPAEGDAASIADLDLDRVVLATLQRNGFHTVGELRALSDEALLGLKGIGPKTLGVIRSALQLRG